mmetsp:Transcript_39148/g.126607  ORF Transcript_39148/g.126607 Transcript_39148/m.126607 type:complete len:272 (-) Transcript_39148:73-888(-)
MPLLEPTTSSPSTSRMSSPAARPAEAAAPPGITETICPPWSALMPSEPAPSLDNSTQSSSSSSSPSASSAPSALASVAGDADLEAARRRTTVRLREGLDRSESACSSVVAPPSPTATPSTSATTSPARRPAMAAGVSGATVSTSLASTRMPARSPALRLRLRSSVSKPPSPFPSSHASTSLAGCPSDFDGLARRPPPPRRTRRSGADVVRSARAACTPRSAVSESPSTCSIRSFGMRPASAAGEPEATEMTRFLRSTRRPTLVNSGISRRR